MLRLIAYNDEFWSINVKLYKWDRLQTISEHFISINALFSRMLMIVIEMRADNNAAVKFIVYNEAEIQNGTTGTV